MLDTIVLVAFLDQEGKYHILTYQDFFKENYDYTEIYYIDDPELLRVLAYKKYPGQTRNRLIFELIKETYRLKEAKGSEADIQMKIKQIKALLD